MSNTNTIANSGTNPPALDTTLTANITTGNAPIAIQPGKGPFTVVCQHFPTPDPTMEAKRIKDMYQFLFQTPAITPERRTSIVSTQPAPLPMLAIREPANTPVVLHGIGLFYPTLGLSPGNHPAAGSTLALLGDAAYVGCNPPVVSLPIDAFQDEQTWPTATTATITTLAQNHTTMLQPEPNSDTRISRLIPLPPHLVHFFTANATLTLLQLAKAFFTYYATAAPDMQQMYELPAQFLQAAITAPTAAAGNNMASQLAITLTPITPNADIKCWATAHFTVYSMLPIGQGTPPWLQPCWAVPQHQMPCSSPCPSHRS